MKYKVWHIGKERFIQDDTNVYMDPDGDVIEIDEGTYGHMYKNVITSSVIVVRNTGVTDPNGIEIHEGDRLFATGNLTDDLQYIGDVVWDKLDARWEVHSFHGNFAYIPSGCVVQGNIYEAKEEE